jgi:uncharacterized membrane protein YbhN (UPF0104 family)
MLSSQSHKGSIPWLRFAQIGFTLVLVAVLMRSIDWPSFWGSLVNLRWHYIALSVVLLAGSHSLNVMRWRVLLGPGALAFGTAMAYYGAGLFSNNFLPTGVGGDGVRAALAGRHFPWPRALASVALDRLIGLAGLSFFLVPGLWLGLPDSVVERLALRELSSAGIWALAAIGGVLVLAVGVGFFWRQTPWLSGAVTRAWNLLGPALPTNGGRLGWLRPALAGYALSVVSIAALVAAYWAVLVGLQAGASWGAVIWVVIISSLSLMLPLSINGLGVMETVFVVVLGGYGVLAPMALAAALLVRGLGIAFSLLGGLISLGVSWSPDVPRDELTARHSGRGADQAP